MAEREEEVQLLSLGVGYYGGQYYSCSGSALQSCSHPPVPDVTGGIILVRLPSFEGRWFTNLKTVDSDGDKTLTNQRTPVVTSQQPDGIYKAKGVCGGEADNHESV